MLLKELGARIREERLLRRLTLETLSEKTGLSKSFLSQVERGLTEPSITSFKKISKEFGFSVVNLFSINGKPNGKWRYENAVLDHAERKFAYVENVEVVRADKRKRLAPPGSRVMYDLLTPDMNRRLEMMYMKVAKGENLVRNQCLTHQERRWVSY